MSGSRWADRRRSFIRRRYTKQAATRIIVHLKPGYQCMASIIDKADRIRRALAWPWKKIVWAWHNRPPFLNSFEELRRLTINVSVVLLVVSLVFVTVKATYDKTLVIEPISVPKALEEMGYTGSAVAQKLMDRVSFINDKSSTSKDRVQYGSEGRFAAASAIRLPSSSVSIQTVVTLLRGAFGVQGDRIAGEITMSPPDDARMRPAYVLTLHFTHLGKRFSSIQKSGDLNELVDLAGLAIVGQFDGVVLAAYFQETMDWDKADQLIARLIASCDPEVMPWALNMRGLSLNHQHRKAEAIATFEKIVRLYPKFAIAYSNWGYALYRVRDYAGAIEKYRKAIELEPEHASAYGNLGDVLLEQCDDAGAIEKYRKAIELEPKFAAAYIRWGRALSGQHDYAGAVEKYQTAIELDPTDATAYNGWGFLLFDQHDHAGAIEKYRKAIELEPKSALSYVAWGVTLADQHDYAGAVEKFQKAIGLEPKDVLAYIAWGIALSEQHDYAGAIEKYRTAAELDPREATVYNNWGLALSGQHDYAGAIEKYQKAVELNPRLAEAYGNWGDALAAKGDQAGAAEKYHHADELAGK
jgi:tetratricopeptide (TPR) repeat protein